MRRYTTFHDCNVFEGLAHRLPEAEIEETTQPNPIEPPVADSSTVLAVAPSLPENNVSHSDCHTCHIRGGVGCLCHYLCCIGRWASWSSHPLKTTGNVKSPTESEYPRWVKVHCSHTAVSVGSVPCNPGDLQQCHCNCSYSQQKRAWCLLEEKWWALRDISSSTSSGSSPEPAAQEGENPEAKSRVLPLGFQKILRSLTIDEPPKMEIDHPQCGVAQELLVEPAMATVISTTICENWTMGAVYLPTVTASMGLVNLKAPSVVVGCQGLAIEELTEEDLVEGCP